MCYGCGKVYDSDGPHNRTMSPFYVEIFQWNRNVFILTKFSLLATHCNGVIMSAMASQITGVSIVCSTIYSGADQRKHQSATSRAFLRGIHRWPGNSPNKRPVTRKMFPSDDIIMLKVVILTTSVSVQGCPFQCTCYFVAVQVRDETFRI